MRRLNIDRLIQAAADAYTWVDYRVGGVKQPLSTSRLRGGEDFGRAEIVSE